MWQKLVGSWIGKQITSRLTSWQTTILGAIIVGVVAATKYAGYLDEDLATQILIVAGSAGILLKDGAKSAE